MKKLRVLLIENNIEYALPAKLAVSILSKLQIFVGAEFLYLKSKEVAKNMPLVNSCDILFFSGKKGVNIFSANREAFSKNNIKIFILHEKAEPLDENVYYFYTKKDEIVNKDDISLVLSKLISNGKIDFEIPYKSFSKTKLVPIFFVKREDVIAVSDLLNKNGIIYSVVYQDLSATIFTDVENIGVIKDKNLIFQLGN